MRWYSIGNDEFSGDIETIKKIVSKGYDINAFNIDGVTPITLYLDESLHRCLHEEYNRDYYDNEPINSRIIIENIKWFIENGADLNKFDNTNEDAVGPLYIAFFYYDYVVAQFLIENGANPYTDYDGDTMPTGNCLMRGLDMEALSGDIDEDDEERIKYMVWLLMDYGIPYNGFSRIVYEAGVEYKKERTIPNYFYE